MINDGIRHRRYLARVRTASWHRRMNRRRTLVLEHMTGVLSALVEGKTVPDIPATGSLEVDERLRRLHAALETVYLPNLSICRELANNARP